ncbi:MAG: YdcF family protein [Spirochaetales bacterium]|nr:YdcF family protein [Spirochaetales bacterium]
MFFYLSKIFAAFFFPYPIFLVLAFLAAWTLRYRWIGKALMIFAVSLTFLSTGIVSGFLIGRLESVYSRPPTVEADVAVVLSGMINPLAVSGDMEFMGAVDRILLGEKLLRQGKVANLILSGGSGLMLSGQSEAELLRNWLIDRGVPAEQLILDAYSRNTAENAAESARIIREKKFRRVLLITSAFHMLRSDLSFQSQGLTVVPLPVDYYGLSSYPFPEAYGPSPQSLSVSMIAFKEFAGLLAYYLAGYI